MVISARVPESEVCVQPFTSPVRTECGMFLMCCNVHVGCFVVRGCAVSRRYMVVCNCDVYINGRRYVCCSECNVVSDDCDEPTPAMFLGCDGVGGVGGEWVGDLEEGLEEWGGVTSVCVVGLDYVCIWQVQVSGYCSRRIPAYIRCTQCSILLQFMDICFLPCICLWHISQIQICLCVVVGPGFVSSSTAFVRHNLHGSLQPP